VPIGELPVVGRLFGSPTNASKTEIVLLITPRIVRALVRPELRFEEFSSGTEAAIGAPPLVLQNVTLSAIGAPVSPAAVQARPLGAAAPAAAKLALQGPPPLTGGEPFTFGVTLDMFWKLRSVFVDFAFNPSHLRFIRAEPSSL
jgi:general secretion pathway protein D